MSGIELCVEYRNKKIKLDEEQSMLDILNSTGGIGAANTDGMPHSHDPQRTTEKYSLQIEFLESRIATHKAELDALKGEVESFICSIEDTKMAMILQYRVLHGLLWKEVATLIGGTATENSVKLQYSNFTKTKDEDYGEVKYEDYDEGYVKSAHKSKQH